MLLASLYSIFQNLVLFFHVLYCYYCQTTAKLLPNDVISVNPSSIPKPISSQALTVYIIDYVIQYIITL